ncbi:hypothetical protein SSP531S_56420 [Streptomyces spongiicola]|uniref:Uncharacterized protein n=1 Tax=Streptomyces spongiicola TaxID=1690221 RepID=A0A388T7S3_9ACTN|nr:DUF6257 family protein [Streptomyces spongiicola]GBQ04150.1 hypothetical protein SSP531S_56420 [Streptomyces spongiicola]
MRARGRQGEPRLTAGEKTKVAWYVARMAKRGLADDRVSGGRVHQRDLERKVDQIIEQARNREEREEQRDSKGR